MTTNQINMPTQEELTAIKTNPNCGKYSFLAPSGRPLLVIERVPHPNDIKGVFERGCLVTHPTYYGEWRDITAQAQEEYTQTHRHTKSAREEKETTKPTKEEEFEAAKALLAKLSKGLKD